MEDQAAEVLEEPDRPTIQYPNLASLERAVCEVLERFQAGTLNPFAESTRLDSKGRRYALIDLGKRLGFRYSRCTLENFVRYDKKQGPALAELEAFAEDMPERLAKGGLMLFGTPGTGKDHLMAAMLKIAIAKHGLSVAWYDGGSLYDEIYFAVKGDSEVRLEKLFADLQRPHILAISDPQPPAGELSDAQTRRLRDVIDRRYRAGKSVWLSTNIDERDAMERMLTKPVAERLREGALQVYCDWPSHRDRKAK